jgi:hypothetical protein
MEQVKQPLLVHLVSEILLGIIGILAWGVGFIPQSAWVQLERTRTLLRQFRQAKLLIQSLWKLLGALWNQTLESNKRKWVKEMDAISKYHDFEIIHGWYISILIYIFKNIVCILTFEYNLFFCFLVLSYKAQ